MDWIYALDLMGTLVFAISGMLTAIENKFDLVGAFIVGLVTAVGGGTLRDLLIGETPVGWMKNPVYLWVILLALVLAFAFRRQIIRLQKGLFLFDTIGIGLFTILGVEKTLAVGLSLPIALIMGVVSAVFGGVIRDVLTNVVPLIFRKEIYASACLVGGLIYVGLEALSVWHTLNMLVAMGVVMVIRYLSVRYHWSLHVLPEEE